ncbi:probable serine/threonine-protein kinase clkA [Hydra vulgaris]|uniref:Probable serine/threonine-protein kinase clkA n=1 Tax=Hydra vulgaris TaxID=6087 RepID=A0ABM4DCU2_HYDVU
MLKWTKIKSRNGSLVDSSEIEEYFAKDNQAIPISTSNDIEFVVGSADKKNYHVRRKSSSTLYSNSRKTSSNSGIINSDSETNLNIELLTENLKIISESEVDISNNKEYSNEKDEEQPQINSNNGKTITPNKTFKEITFNNEFDFDTTSNSKIKSYSLEIDKNQNDNKENDSSTLNKISKTEDMLEVCSCHCIINDLKVSNHHQVADHNPNCHKVADNNLNCQQVTDHDLYCDQGAGHENPKINLNDNKIFNESTPDCNLKKCESTNDVQDKKKKNSDNNSNVLLSNDNKNTPGFISDENEETSNLVSNENDKTFNFVSDVNEKNKTTPINFAKHNKNFNRFIRTNSKRKKWRKKSLLQIMNAITSKEENDSTTNDHQIVVMNFIHKDKNSIEDIKAIEMLI